MKAVIFDFDGLIADTENMWYVSFAEVMKEIADFDVSIEMFAVCIGTENTLLFERMEQETGRSFDWPEVMEKVSEVNRERVKHIEPREGVEDYLHAAKSMGLSIALATSSERSWVEPLLKKMNLFSYFDLLKTRDDVARIKPDPELYLAALESLGIQPKEAVVFEDSLNGLTAARAAGIPCVIVPNQVTSHLPFEGQALRLNSMKDLPLEQLLAQLKNQ